MVVNNKYKLYKALKAIAEGYRVDVHYDTIIRVEDPEAEKPWDDPYIVIDLKWVEEFLKDER